MNQVLKENIATQILKSSTSIPTSMLAEIIQEDQIDVIRIVSGLINSKSVFCLFDEVSKSIISHEINHLDSTVEKVNNCTSKLYFQSYEKLIK